jgi:hypothetical protein
MMNPKYVDVLLLVELRDKPVSDWDDEGRWLCSKFDFTFCSLFKELSDFRLVDCPELKEDKNDKSETELNGRYNNMAAERVIKSPPIIIPDTDAMLIKKTTI